MATHGLALNGAAAAALGAATVYKILSGHMDRVGAGEEQIWDLEHRCCLATKLTYNDACRFHHRRFSLRIAPDLRLREALTLGSIDADDAALSVPEHSFAARVSCTECGREEELWRLRASLAPEELACGECGQRRRVTGFDSFDRLASDALPPHLLDQTLTQLGLRPGEIFTIERGGRADAHFELDPTVERDGEHRAPDPCSGDAKVVLAGLGTIGSYAAGLVARMPRVGHLTLVDPDTYEAGNLLSQNIEPDAVGQPKASAQARALRALRPDLEIRTFCKRLEELPLGEYRDAIVLGALDSRAARLGLARRAWSVDSVYVDTAVGGGASLEARADVYLPGDDAPCFECGFSQDSYAELDQVYPCSTPEEIR